MFFRPSALPLVSRWRDRTRGDPNPNPNPIPNPNPTLHPTPTLHQVNSATLQLLSDIGEAEAL